jgi:hypothetical protein
MPDVQPLEVVRVDLIGDFNASQEIVQSYQFRNLGGVTVAPESFLDDMEELLGALWQLAKGFHSVLTAFRRIRAQNVSTGQLLGVRALGAALVGNQIDQPVAVQTTAVLSFPTTTPRVILKKMYGPITENQLNATGAFNPQTQIELANVGAFLLTLYNATNSQYQYGYQSPKALSWVVPVGAQFITAPGSRRSRKPGVGS